MKRHGAVEVFLQPGDFHFGDKNAIIKTVLGSCISITLWHPTKHVGGMCHYMLPHRVKRSAQLDGRYGDEAMELFMAELKKNNTHPHEYEVKLFGGGNMFPNIIKQDRQGTHISLRNIEKARELIRQFGFSVKAEHLGGDGHRNIIFDVSNGHVWVKQSAREEAA